MQFCILAGDQMLAELLFDEQLCISVIAYMELLSFPGITPEESERIGIFLSEFEIIPLSDPIRDRGIQLRRESRMKLPDCVIAATAHMLDFPLVTADKGFQRVVDLNLILLER